MVTFKFYLDSRIPQDDGRCPVRIAFTSARKAAYHATGIAVFPTQWDKAAQKVVKHPNAFTYNSQLNNLRNTITDKLFELERKNAFVGKSITQIRDLLVKEEKEPARVLFKKCFDDFNASHSGRTADIYVATWRRILAFDNQANNLPIEKIDRKWLESFDAFLAKTSPSANARAIHLRNIRAVFNYALDEELITAYPFRKFKIKHAKTPKRALPIETLRFLFSVELPEYWMHRYRELFKLMFLLIGINIADLCNLKEIAGGRIEFIRAKTHRPYSIKVEPEAAAIIDELHGENYLLYPMDTNSNYRCFYFNFCKGLKAIREFINKNYPEIELRELTTYWARHSWATIAAGLDIPKETIAAALGHGGNSVTDIYIDFDRKKIDAANRQVIDFVLHEKR